MLSSILKNVYWGIEEKQEHKTEHNAKDQRLLIFHLQQLNIMSHRFLQVLKTVPLSYF